MIQILLATYNGEKYIKTQLDSLLAQTNQDFEVLVRDDCSTDNTLSILKEYEKKHPDKFKVTQNQVPTGNAKDNFFLLMNDASADYVMFCDQDDFWLPDKIEITLKKMKETEKKDLPVLVHTDLSVTDENLNITHKSFFKMQHFEKCVDNTPLNRAIAQNTVTGCTVMINKPLLDLVKGKNHPDIIMHDWFLAIVASAFGRIRCINTPTIYYRQHQHNNIGAKSFKFKLIFKTKSSLNRTYAQALYFANTYKENLCENVVYPIIRFANISLIKSKKERLKILFKYKFFKHSLIKKIVQLIQT